MKHLSLKITCHSKVALVATEESFNNVGDSSRRYRAPQNDEEVIGESGWESNPPRPATRPVTGFEDQEAHRDFTTPMRKARAQGYSKEEGIASRIIRLR